MSAHPAARSACAATRGRRVVVALAFAAIVFDGYDLMIYGAIVPELLAHPGWDLTPADVGLIGIFTTLGILIGAPRHRAWRRGVDDDCARRDFTPKADSRSTTR